MFECLSGVWESLVLMLCEASRPVLARLAMDMWLVWRAEAQSVAVVSSGMLQMRTSGCQLTPRAPFKRFGAEGGALQRHFFRPCNECVWSLGGFYGVQPPGDGAIPAARLPFAASA